MSSPTILAHLTDAKRSPRLIDTARQLVQLEQGRLVGVYAGAQYILYPSMIAPVTAGYYEEQRSQYKGFAEENAHLFRQATAGDTFLAEWRYIPTSAYPVSDLLMPLVRTSDLLVTDLLQPTASAQPFDKVAETLALESGRPTLLIPEHASVDDPVFERILIAWDGSRESARATFDALSLLSAATEVWITCVEEPMDGRTVAELPSVDIAETLTHHGIQTTADRIERKGRSTGEALLDRADDIGATMLVMGAYGHTRWREFVFGGATRHVLKNAALPVFVSH